MQQTSARIGQTNPNSKLADRYLPVMNAKQQRLLYNAGQ